MSHSLIQPQQGPADLAPQHHAHRHHHNYQFRLTCNADGRLFFLLAFLRFAWQMWVWYPRIYGYLYPGLEDIFAVEDAEGTTELS